MALFLVGVPQNVVDLHTTRAEALLVGDPDLILTMARLPVARVVPRDLNPFQLEQIGFPIGWLLDGVASGRVPEPATVDEGAIAEAELMLSVYQTTDAPTGACVPIPPHTPVRVRQGDVIKINSRKVSLRRWSNGRIVTDASYTAAGLGRTLRIVGVPLDLIVQPTPADQPAELCR
jgi:hypothetical protein